MSQPKRTASAYAPVLGGALNQNTSPSAAFNWDDPQQRRLFQILGGVTLLLILAYLNSFWLVASQDWQDPLYSHGYIVPVFAAVLFWIRREAIKEAPSLERWIGVGVLVAGLSMRIVAATYDMAPVDHLSFLVSIFGVFMMVGGLDLIRWAGPALGFLAFMFPLPSRLEQTLLLKLQTLAAMCSTAALQTMGVAAYRQVNTIYMPSAGDNIPLEVADACSGLRMLTIFCALAVAMVFLVERPWWDKFAILLSAVPIALIVNVVRIVCTGLCYLWFGTENEFINKLAHDWAGFLMMPLALGILWLELQILSHLTVPEESARVQPLGGSGRAPSRGASVIPVR